MQRYKPTSVFKNIVEGPETIEFQKASFIDQKKIVRRLVQEHLELATTETECQQMMKMQTEVDLIINSARLVKYVYDYYLAHENLKVVR